MNRLIALLAPLLMAPALHAQTMDDIARLTILPGWQTGDGTHMAGLNITLAPGWKTYWRSPGDAGIPPQVTLSGGNIAASRFLWPVPQVFDQNGLRSIGYHDGVVVPVALTPAQPGAPIRLAGTLDIGVCEEICVPVRFTFDATLVPGGPQDPAILASLLDQPLSAQQAGAGPATCRITPIDDGLTVTTRLTLPPTGGSEAVVIEAGDPMVWVSEPDVTRDADIITATVDMIHVSGGAFALDRSAVRITVLGDSHAVDIRGCTGG